MPPGSSSVPEEGGFYWCGSGLCPQTSYAPPPACHGQTTLTSFWSQRTSTLWAHQVIGHRVIGPLHLDMPVGMHLADADMEEGKGIGGQGPQGVPLQFHKALPDLLLGGAVDPQPGDGAVPGAQKFVLLRKAFEPAALERLFDIAHPALHLAVMARSVGPYGQGHKPVMLRNSLILFIDVGIIETGPGSPRL